VNPRSLPTECKRKNGSYQNNAQRGCGERQGCGRVSSSRAFQLP
jgi:hypothetical protein